VKNDAVSTVRVLGEELQTTFYFIFYISPPQQLRVPVHKAKTFVRNTPEFVIMWFDAYLPDSGGGRGERT